MIAELGASQTIGPTSLSAMEAGEASDRGSGLMRAMLWRLVSDRCRAVHAGVRDALRQNRPALESLAIAIVDAEDHTLSGPRLLATLQALDTQPIEPVDAPIPA